ncbi:hypothetical protein D3C74_95610 [compost metagenome]
MSQFESMYEEWLHSNTLEPVFAQIRATTRFIASVQEPYPPTDKVAILRAQSKIAL